MSAVSAAGACMSPLELSAQITPNIVMVHSAHHRRDKNPFKSQETIIAATLAACAV